MIDPLVQFFNSINWLNPIIPIIPIILAVAGAIVGLMPWFVRALMSVGVVCLALFLKFAPNGVEFLNSVPQFRGASIETILPLCALFVVCLWGVYLQKLIWKD